MEQTQAEETLIKLGNGAVATMLRTKRLSGGYTQQQVAEKTKLSRSSVANIEAGRQNINLKQLYRFAAAVDCTVSISLEELEDEQ